MSGEAKRRAGRFGEIGITVLGIVLAMTPLALWLAWTETQFFTILALAAIAMALIFVLARFPRSDSRHRRRVAQASKRPVLGDEFIAELHRLFPLIYHHRRPGDRRFREKMERLLALRKWSDE